MIRKYVAGFMLGLFPIKSFSEVYVVTGTRSNITSLTKPEAIALFLGYANINSGKNSAVLVDLPSGNTRDEFYEKLTGKSNVQINAHWSKLVFTGKAMPPNEAKSVIQAKETISSGFNVIGYVSRDDLSNTMKVLYVVQ